MPFESNMVVAQPDGDKTSFYWKPLKSKVVETAGETETSTPYASKWLFGKICVWRAIEYLKNSASSSLEYFNSVTTSLLDATNIMFQYWVKIFFNVFTDFSLFTWCIWANFYIKLVVEDDDATRASVFSIIFQLRCKLKILLTCYFLLVIGICVTRHRHLDQLSLGNILIFQFHE